jgi:NAD(P)-dependent dehydrogenase (short-subunit alcohol dehydrogenase family)
MTRRVLVHGATTPIGATFTRLLAEAGDAVAAIDAAPSKRPQLNDLVADHPGRVSLHADAGRAVDEVIAEAIEALGGSVDLLVLAGWDDKAGPALAWREANLSLHKLEPAALLHQMAQNAVRPLEVVRAARAALRHGTTPVLLGITSWLGSFTDRRDGGHYGQAMSAAALQMAMRTLAFELEPDGITVITGNPGLYRTALHAPEIQPLPDAVVAGFIAVLAGDVAPMHGTIIDWHGNLKTW